MRREIKLLINGEKYCIDVEPGELLVDVLREKISLTGTKKGCGTGDCGACTVIMDDRPVVSCLVLAVAADNKTIQTIEGLSENGDLHPIQKSFIKHGAIQCGYCIPGIIMMAKYILDRNPNPTENEIRTGISGNLCRCTGYTKIVDAIMDTSRNIRRDT